MIQFIHDGNCGTNGEPLAACHNAICRWAATIRIERSFKGMKRTPWAYRLIGLKREHHDPGRTLYVLGLWWWTWTLRTWP